MKRTYEKRSLVATRRVEEEEKKDVDKYEANYGKETYTDSPKKTILCLCVNEMRIMNKGCLLEAGKC